MTDTSKKTAGAGMVLILLLAGCEIPHPIDPLVIPPASDIEYIEITRLKPNGEHQNEFKITDSQRIEAILAELRRNNQGYSTAMRGHTPQEHAISLVEYEVLDTIVWVGHGWLGGVDREHKDSDGGQTSHFRKLDAEQHRRLLLLIQQSPGG